MAIFDIETTGFNPMEARITCICIDKETFIGEDEGLILRNFFEYLVINRIEELAGFNIAAFDIPFIVKRCLITNTPMPKCFMSKIFIDLRKVVNSFFISYNKYEKGDLDSWAKILLGKEKQTNGEEVVKAYEEKNWDLIKSHCQNDVLITSALYNRCKEVGLI